jgi:lipoyl(octanoyl) transferase
MHDSVETSFLKKATQPHPDGVTVLDWGLIDYAEALEKQLKLVEQVQEGKRGDTIILCQHPPVVTLGRATEPGDVFGWTGAVYEIQRGGRATYHGPNQLVAYPIIDLTRRNRDLHGYLRTLESILILTVAEFGLEAHREEGSTGVWIGPLKIASIGVGVKKWVTYHGVALNLTYDKAAFLGINPCGFSSEVMTSVEEQVGRPVNITEAKKILVRHMLDLL